MDMLTLEVLAAQHPRAAVACPTLDEVDCAACASKWVDQDVYNVEELELATDLYHGVDCPTCEQKMEHHTWTC